MQKLFPKKKIVITEAGWRRKAASRRRCAVAPWPPLLSPLPQSRGRKNFDYYICEASTSRSRP